MNATLSTDNMSEMTSLEAAFARANNGGKKLNVPTNSNKVHIAKVKTTQPVVAQAKASVIVPSFSLDLSVIEDEAVTKAKSAFLHGLQVIKDEEDNFHACERENIRLGKLKGEVERVERDLINTTLPRVKGIEDAFKLSIEKARYNIERAVKAHFGESASADVIAAAIKKVEEASPEFVSVIRMGQDAQTDREDVEAQIVVAKENTIAAVAAFNKSTETMAVAKAAIQSAKDMLVKKEAALVKAQAKAAKKLTK